MRHLFPLVAAPMLATCEAPKVPLGAESGGDNVISTLDSSSGSPSGDVIAPSPAVVQEAAAAGEAVPVATAATIPSIFHGSYDESRAACGRASEYRLVITPSELRFHESIGRVRSVSVEGPKVARVTAVYEGEGETWSNSRELRLSHDDVMIMVGGDGTALTRVRCP